MSTDYDPVRRLVQLGLPALASAVLHNNEATIVTKTGVIYSIFKAAAVINVTEDGLVLLGGPFGRQLCFKPSEIRARPGVSEDPYGPGVTWQRFHQ